MVDLAFASLVLCCEYALSSHLLASMRLAAGLIGWYDR